MPDITDRELALAKLKMFDECYNQDGSIVSLKSIIKHMEKLIKENKAARKELKKFEIQVWPPKITIEWEFPFREKI